MSSTPPIPAPNEAEKHASRIPIDWSLLPSAVEQRDNIRKCGGVFSTKDRDGNPVSTSDGQHLSADFRNRGIKQNGWFPAEYYEPEYSDVGDGVDRPTGVNRHTVELLLLGHPKSPLRPDRLAPYPNKSPCGIWIRWCVHELPENPIACFHCLGKSVDFKSLETDWKQSNLCEKLVQYLKENAHIMRPIHRIVCFNLKSHNGPEDDTSFRQHLVAITIRDTLQDIGTDTPIQIIAQGAYCKHWVEPLAKMEFGITVVEEPDGFLHVDQNTLVITMSEAKTHFRDWALDKTFEVGGPAALLCPPVERASFSNRQTERWMKSCRENGLFLDLNNGYIPIDESRFNGVFGSKGDQTLYWQKK